MITCPLCKAPRSQAGLPTAIPFGIPAYWTPEEAFAIFELISEMRDIIGNYYAAAVDEIARDYYRADPVELDDPADY
jgi:hypothetical protein